MSSAKNIIFILLVLLTGLGSCRAQVNVYDGFETKKLSRAWTTDRMVSSALAFQSAIVRNGHGAVKITLRTGDVFEAGSSKTHGSERDELCEAKELWSAEEKEYEYQFSLFLPDSFLLVPTRLVIAQWKQKCPHESACSDDSPVIAIRYVSGRLYMTLQTGDDEQVLFQTKEEIRNKWLDFRFKICFSRSGKGQIDAWLNEKQVIGFKGITCYSPERGYANTSLFYFKMGLYRNTMAEPMSIYIDEYHKREIKDK